MENRSPLPLPDSRGLPRHIRICSLVLIVRTRHRCFSCCRCHKARPSGRTSRPRFDRLTPRVRPSLSRLVPRYRPTLWNDRAPLGSYAAPDLSIKRCTFQQQRQPRCRGYGTKPAHIEPNSSRNITRSLGHTVPHHDLRHLR
jgi:hypothetical protein